MRSKQTVHIVRSYAVVVTALLFVVALLIMTMSLSAIIEEKTLPFSAAYTIDDKASSAQTALTMESLLVNDALNWQPFVKQSFGLSEQPHWFRIQADSFVVGSQYIFEINYGLLDYIDVWVFSQADQTPLDPLQAISFAGGDAQSFSLRPILYEQFLFPFEAETSAITIMLRIKSSGPINVPIRIWQQANFIEYSGSHKLFMGLFFGYLMAMSLINLFIYATTRNPTFALYTGHVISLAMVAATLHGIGFRYFWPDNVWFQERAIAFFACSSLILIIWLSIQVLDLKNTSRRAYHVLKALGFLFVVLGAMSFIIPYSIALKSILILIALATPIILTSSLLLAVKGNLIARYFSAAWAILLLSGIAITIESLSGYELPVEASYLLMVGATAETLLLAVALAVNVKVQYTEAQEAKALAIESERKAMLAKDELLKLQIESKQALEYSVEERNLELKIAMRELSDANQELERLSAIDALTGLMNRRYFDKRLLAEARRSRREQRYLSLAMLDIDFFKKINDTYGHLAGDECLKVFAKTLQQHIQRPSDIICRYGGEEFVVILPGTELEGASQLMEKIRHAVEETVTEFEGSKISMTVSIGLTSKIIASDDEQSLILALADKLLYQAKHTGRNRVVAQVY